MHVFRKEKKFVLSARRNSFASWVQFFLPLIVLVTIFLGAYYVVTRYQLARPSLKNVYDDWENRQYLAVYEATSSILAKRPLNGTVLALHGFASYYLSIEQTDSSASQDLLQETISSLRNAWYRVSERDKSQISYILGKAYYQRGFYYADLSMKYLDYAAASHILYDDLDEFRGLTAALLGDYEKSNSAFISALAKKPSDLLLFALSKNYIATKEYEKARQYLLETIRITNDDLLVMRCRYELGILFLTESKIDEARIEFESILEKDPNSADAHYGLGVIYESLGDLIKARAEWRKTIKSNPIHVEARNKLNM